MPKSNWPVDVPMTKGPAGKLEKADLHLENGMKLLADAISGKMFLNGAPSQEDAKMQVILSNMPKKAVDYFPAVKSYYATLQQFSPAIKATWA